MGSGFRSNIESLHSLHTFLLYTQPPKSEAPSDQQIAINQQAISLGRQVARIYEARLRCSRHTAAAAHTRCIAVQIRCGGFGCLSISPLWVDLYFETHMRLSEFSAACRNIQRLRLFSSCGQAVTLVDLLSSTAGIILNRLIVGRRNKTLLLAFPGLPQIWQVKDCDLQ